MLVKVIRPITMLGRKLEPGDVVELGEHRVRRLMAKQPSPVAPAGSAEDAGGEVVGGEDTGAPRAKRPRRGG